MSSQLCKECFLKYGKHSVLEGCSLQEQERIKEAIEKAKEEDARQLEQKRLAGAALLRDVMAGNAAMIERKKQQRIQDILEEQRIAAFVKERDAKALARPLSPSLIS